MKFSVRQILASAAGAVLAALIASSFGVKGTIIGVAIGSVVATMGTALVGQSIERGHEAVKQVVVRAPDSTLLRRFGGTEASGQPEATMRTGPVPAESSSATSGSEAADDRAATMESKVAEAGSHGLEVSAVADAPTTERFEGVTLPPERVGRWRWRLAGPLGSRYSWQAIAGTAGVVFLLALLFVTAVELSSGKPLSSIFGDHGSGPSVKDIFVPSPAPASTTTTTNNTTVPSTTTTTTATGPVASSTTTVSTTTTTSPSGGSTTTTSGGSTTTTSPGGGGTTTSIPG